MSGTTPSRAQDGAVPCWRIPPHGDDATPGFALDCGPHVHGRTEGRWLPLAAYQALVAVERAAKALLAEEARMFPPGSRHLFHAEFEALRAALPPPVPREEVQA